MAYVRGWCQNYTLCFFNDRFSRNNWKDNHMSWLVTPMLWMKFELLANIIFREEFEKFYFASTCLKEVIREG